MDINRLKYHCGFFLHRHGQWAKENYGTRSMNIRLQFPSKMMIFLTSSGTSLASRGYGTGRPDLPCRDSSLPTMTGSEKTGKTKKHYF